MDRLRFVALVVVVAYACAPVVRRTIQREPTTAEMAQFWSDPGASRRDLLNGVADRGARPIAEARYEVLKRDTTGFSITYRVRDKAGRAWHVKIGPEAQTEIVSSRILWALGYHEVPSYFVERWIAVDRGAHGSLLGGARFRPDAEWLRPKGTWSWQRNPFVGTRAYQGLLVVMMVLNSTDLKNENNELYEVVDRPREGARLWYVVKDLGASLGETGRFDPRRGWIDGFEREPFITGVHQGHVLFGYRGRHEELLAYITPADVRWACERLSRLTDAQWRDAFRAGHYDEETTTRYVRRIRQKIDRGLALRDASHETAGPAAVAAPPFRRASPQLAWRVGEPMREGAGFTTDGDARPERAGSTTSGGDR